MKCFIRLFLLLSFLLINASGLQAVSCQYRSFHSGIKSSESPSGSNLKALPYNHQLNYSAPVLIKKEYRKIRGTKEEDDDKKSLHQKRTKGLENTSKYLGKAITGSSSPRAIAKFYAVSKRGIQSSWHFFSINGCRLYNLFQVFRI